MARGPRLLNPPIARLAVVLGALAACGLAAGAAQARKAGPTVVRQVTRLALGPNRGIALQDGVNVTAAESTLWARPGSNFWQLQPSHGTELASDGVTSRRGAAGCRAARWGSPLASSPLRAGTWYCVKTWTGDYGEVKIEQVTPSQVVISYTLWRGA